MKEEIWDTPNHNKNWTISDRITLLQLWDAGNPVATCARKLGRTKLSVVCKLVGLGGPNTQHLNTSDESTWYNNASLYTPNTTEGVCAKSDVEPTHYSDMHVYIEASHNPIKKDTPTMNKFAAIKNFNDSAAQVTESLTLDDFINEIADKEAAIKALDRLENKPKAVVNKIAKLTEEIAALVAQCDAQVK